ncbi:A1 family peptidase [Phanerochaete sordida]|uniref:A1 family peptidase n=1 Tax=Phanerochaete sordida TaxID=48140 RepID=A0A9P3GE42_9APHY|nr:A1 family peptidase [Phanerochaete sordida]
MLASTLTVVCLALSVASAAPPTIVVDKLPISLPLARRVKSNLSFGRLADIDRARARVIQSKGLGHAQKRGSTFPVALTNGVVAYSVAVGVGTPPAIHNLLLDTGSSLTWIGANSSYNRTSSSVDSGQQLAMEYGSGSFNGEGYFDTLTIGNLVVNDQFIGVSNGSSTSPDGLDGILGLGPTDLNEGISNSSTVEPTVTDNAWSQGLLDKYEIGIFFHPTTSDSGAMDGELTMGGVRRTGVTSPITTVPITSTFPASEFVGFNQSVTYGASGSTILSNTAGIADTGTTLILLATDAFDHYTTATGATMDPATGLLKLPAVKYDSIQSLFFKIGGKSWEFTKNAQIWPRSLNSNIGGDADSVYLIVGDIGTPSGEGLDFINGYVFMQRFYTVYTSKAPSFGIAKTAFTYAETN